MSNTNISYKNKNETEGLFYENGFRSEPFSWKKVSAEGCLTLLFRGRRNVAESPFIKADKILGSNTKKAYRNLTREGWERSPEYTGTGLREQFINTKTGTHYDPAGFDIIGVNAEGITETGFDTATKLHTLTGTEFAPNGWNYLKTGGEFSVAKFMG